jgi:hypothetical protein
MAIAVNTVYARLYNDNLPSPEQLWQECSAFNRESSRAAADFIGGILTLAGIDEETVSNMDKDTEVCMKSWLSNDATKEKIDFLAQVEHLRWNAFHLASGYTKMSLDEMKEYAKKLGDKSTNYRKDDRRMRHACLVNWDELDTVSAEHDALVAKYHPLAENKPLRLKQSDIENIQNIPKFIQERNKENENVQTH